MGRLVWGAGVNDADHVVQPTVDGKVLWCPFYQRWKGMLRRCYSRAEHAKHPNYKECSVVKDWHSFMNFRSWMASQAWKGKHLDKDILFPGNKVYGPDSCVFVSAEVNTLLNDCSSSRGELPRGVTHQKNSTNYKVRMSGKGNDYLGSFATIEEAILVYQKAKWDRVRSIADEQTDERVKYGLYLHAGNILKGYH